MQQQTPVPGGPGEDPRRRIPRTDALLAELTSGRLRAALDVTEPEPLPEGHPLFAAAVGAAARGAWNRGDFAHARELAAVAGGRVPGRGTGRVM